MRKFVAMCLLVILVGWESSLYAADSECDCNCRTGGLGIKIGKLICGLGVKHFSSELGCDKTIGIGLGLGNELHRFQLGFGFDQGLIGIGFGFKGPDNTTFIGFSVGYDYGDCRMVWPIEE